MELEIKPLRQDWRHLKVETSKNVLSFSKISKIFKESILRLGHYSCDC
jgi:hypothetical protein